VRFLAGCCPTCVIDNTSVIVVAGAGDEAVFAPEMVAFARTLGFAFRAHPVNQPDRKGRVERPFAWVEGNFLAGRTFADFADLNQQALAWCEKVANAKPKRVLGMAPSAAYAVERPCLQPLPAVLPPVYQVAERVVDLYGFVSIETNRYSVPERWVGKTLTVYLYPTELRICPRAAGRGAPASDRRARCEAEAARASPDTAAPAAHAAAEATLLQGHTPCSTRTSRRWSSRRMAAGCGPCAACWIPAELSERPFLAAVAQALQFRSLRPRPPGAMILQQVAGDFFNLDEGDDDA
jgi:hypothetical protein